MIYGKAHNDIYVLVHVHDIKMVLVITSPLLHATSLLSG